MSFTAFKLTDRDGYTRRGESGETLWTVGAIVRPTGTGAAPCGPGVLHGYVSPEVAVLGNPIHGRFDPATMRLFRIESSRPWETGGLKQWTGGDCAVVDELPLPTLTPTERVAWAIMLTPHQSTREWGIGWLSGADRSAGAARAAARAAAAEAAAARAAAAEAAAERAAAEAEAEAAAWAEAAEAAARAAAAEAAAERAAAEAEAAAWAEAAEAAAWAAARAWAEAAEAHLLSTLSLARQVLAGTVLAEAAWEQARAALE